MAIYYEMGINNSVSFLKILPMRQLNTLAFAVAISILLSCCNNNQTGNNQKAANDKQGTATPDSSWHK